MPVIAVVIASFMFYGLPGKDWETEKAPMQQPGSVLPHVK